MIQAKENTFHLKCFACGKSNDDGLNMKFKCVQNVSSCNISIPQKFQSYDGVIHGGIVATMLDAAMVHSLRLQNGDQPVTCRLEVRYLQAVPPNQSLTIKAWKKGTRGKIMLAEAELHCNNLCCARAKGAFIISNQKIQDNKTLKM